MEKEVYTKKEVELLLAAKDKEKEEAVAKERARADAAKEAARIATQAARYNAAIPNMTWCGHNKVSQKHLAFAACVPYAKLRCHQQHLTAANLFQRSL